MASKGWVALGALGALLGLIFLGRKAGAANTISVTLTLPDRPTGGYLQGNTYTASSIITNLTDQWQEGLLAEFSGEVAGNMLAWPETTVPFPLALAPHQVIGGFTGYFHLPAGVTGQGSIRIRILRGASIIASAQQSITVS